jgi:small subunit ribosomal protein S4
VIYRLGFGSSRNQARQFVRHGHVLVNGKAVNIPSAQVRAGDEITVDEAFKKNPFFFKNLETAASRGVPEWLSLDVENGKGKVLELPRREHVTLEINEQLVVELYSK